MRREYLVGCAIGLFILLAGCSDTPAPTADTSAADQKAIKDGEVAWSADWGSKDIDKLLSHYADGASLMLSDQPLAQGKDAIRAALQGVLADTNLAAGFTTSSVDVSKSGDFAYTQGVFTMTKTNPRTKKPETATGKYVIVYRKQADGSWKAVADIGNADAPGTSLTTARKSTPAKKKRKK